MTINFYLRAILVALVLPTVATAQLAVPATATQPARAGHESDQPPANLRGLMNEMLDLLYNLKNESVDTANSDVALRDLAYLERDLAICKMHLPPSIQKLPDSEREDAVSTYRTMMSNLIRLSLDMEDAVIRKNPEQIKTLRTQFDKIEAEGHDKFISQ